MPDMAAICMRRVSRRFGEHWAIRDLDLEIQAGQTVALIGPSGSGKTTVLRLMNRLVDPSSGVVEVLGQDVRAREPSELRRQIGYVIQEIGMLPHYSVRKNVAIVPELLGWSRQRIRLRTDELLELVGLPPAEFAERYPQQLSGGQRQRVGFARALAAEPPIVLLDEPFAALDPITRETLQAEFVQLARKVKKTFVIVTHDMLEAVRVAGRIVVLNDGSIIQDSAASEIVRNPEHPIVERLLGQHRYQLELMTTSLGEALGEHSSLPAERETSLELGPDVSIWEALTLMSSSRTRSVRVQSEHGERTLSREELLQRAG
jgi:osmoprotectant transport system ATP-binding protein